MSIGFPATDWYRKNFLNEFTVPNTGLSSTQDRADWDTDTVKIALFTNLFSTTFSGTYSSDTETGYGALNLATGNAELTGTGYSAGGYSLGTVSMSIASGKVLWTVGTDLTIGTGVVFTGMHGGVVYSTTPTTKWALCALNFGADWDLATGNTLKIQWPNTPATKTLMYIG